MTGAADAPPFDWRPLNGEKPIALHDGRVTGMLYAEKVVSDSTPAFFEFSWLPVDDVTRAEALFGLRWSFCGTRWFGSSGCWRWVRWRWALRLSLDGRDRGRGGFSW
jgi:hypothetical protein